MARRPMPPTTWTRATSGRPAQSQLSWARGVLRNSSESTKYQGGARGNLRDSDVTPSRYDAGAPLYNWGVIYDVPVP